MKYREINMFWFSNPSTQGRGPTHVFLKMKAFIGHEGQVHDVQGGQVGTGYCNTGVIIAIVVIINLLVGLVVKASASRAEDPGFESRLRRDLFGWSHTSDLKIGTPMATLPRA